MNRDEQHGRDGTDAVDAGADPSEILRNRVNDAKAQSGEAISALRELMTDDEILEEYGIDLTQRQK